MSRTPQGCRRGRFQRAMTLQDESTILKYERTCGQNGLLRRGSKTNRSKSRNKSGSLTSVSSLSFSQRSALTSSWRSIKPTAASQFRKILLELEIACPKVKQIFYKAALVDAFNKEHENMATLDEHVKMMVKFFDDLINTVEDDEQCIAHMKQIGCSHAILSRSCAFSADIWERLGEIAMERLCSLEPVIKSREASRAWRTLIACAIDEVRSGFEGEARVFSRKSSSTEALEVSYEDSELQHKLRQMRIEYDSTVPM